MDASSSRKMTDLQYSEHIVSLGKPSREVASVTNLLPVPTVSMVAIDVFGDIAEADVPTVLDHINFLEFGGMTRTSQIFNVFGMRKKDGCRFCVDTYLNDGVYTVTLSNVQLHHRRAAITSSQRFTLLEKELTDAYARIGTMVFAAITQYIIADE